MQVIVVTGGLGSGKSTAAEFFRSQGAWTLDLDDVAAKLLVSDDALLGRVADEFGRDDILLADGRLDRAALARRAFASAEATKRLNAIVHPAVAREIGVSLDQMRLLPEPPLALALEVPLLAEAPVFAEIADVALAIVAPENERIARAVRRGMPEDEARRRVSRQASDAERTALADAVIVNDSSMGDFTDALAFFWRTYISPSGAL